MSSISSLDRALISFGRQCQKGTRRMWRSHDGETWHTVSWSLEDYCYGKSPAVREALLRTAQTKEEKRKEELDAILSGMPAHELSELMEQYR